MPLTREPDADERIANVLEEICDKLDDITGKQSPEVRVNLPPAIVNVPSTLPPTVTVQSERPRMWVFTVHRDSDGFIETITATPARPHGTH
jgi:hypothetical protein